MPSKNVLKIDVPESYYHIYARGGGRRDIYVDEQDYAVFFKLIKRYLSKEKQSDSDNQIYPSYYGKIQLLAFCLLSNHFHLLIYQKDEGVMTSLMRCVLTSYSKYFNKRYNSSGPILESRYKASLIDDDSYLQHISRYIHLNPKNWQTYQYSSLPYYSGEASADWIDPNKILDLFDSRQEYLAFTKDYEDNAQMLQELKYQLANDPTV